MSLGRRLLRFDLIGWIMVLLLIGSMCAAVVFVLWLAFHGSTPPSD